jgi:hypothetical protein
MTPASNRKRPNTSAAFSPTLSSMSWIGRRVAELIDRSMHGSAPITG